MFIIFCYISHFHMNLSYYHHCISAIFLLVYVIVYKDIVSCLMIFHEPCIYEVIYAVITLNEAQCFILKLEIICYCCHLVCLLMTFLFQ